VPFVVNLCVKVRLHDPKEEPLMVERGLKVSAGFATQIAVTTKHVRLKAYFHYGYALLCVARDRDADSVSVFFRLATQRAVIVEICLKKSVSQCENYPNRTTSLYVEMFKYIYVEYVFRRDRYSLGNTVRKWMRETYLRLRQIIIV